MTFCALDQGGYCAKEGQTCNCYGKVQYGKGHTWTPEKDVKGLIGCNNGVFGDPLYGKAKECRCMTIGKLI